MSKVDILPVTCNESSDVLYLDEDVTSYTEPPIKSL